MPSFLVCLREDMLMLLVHVEQLWLLGAARGYSCIGPRLCGQFLYLEGHGKRTTFTLSVRLSLDHLLYMQ